MTKRKTATATDILADEPSASPVDALPVAAGGRRRGRPRKDRPGEQPAAVDEEHVAKLMNGPHRKQVQGMIQHAVHQQLKSSGAAPLSQDPTHSQVATVAVDAESSAVKRGVAAATRNELKLGDNSVASPQLAAEVHDRVAQETRQRVVADNAGGRHPHWWLMRLR